MPPDFLLYGSYGYTGGLIAREAVKRNLNPVLAGRNEDKLGVQARQLGLQKRIFSLHESGKLDKALNEVNLVLNCAGPFSHTADKMVAGCLRTKTHYIDITGEISVFESLARKDEIAKRAGVMLLPGAGFDIVPSDCLAAHLKKRLPSANSLTLALRAISQPSQGTMLSSLQNLPKGGKVRKDGKLINVPAAWKRRKFDFGRGLAPATTIPWGDVSTAYYSTGIPNIEAYMAMPTALHFLLILTRYFGWIMHLALFQKLAKRIIRTLPPGPSKSLRSTGIGLFWGRVEDSNGNHATASLKTPESYAFTARAALKAAEISLVGEVVAGYKTPSLAFGPDFILDFEGAERIDHD